MKGNAMDMTATEASPTEVPEGMVPIEPPAFQWGQRVVALCDLVNDGSYPDVAEGATLVETGAEGEVVQVGLDEASKRSIYLVDFDGCVVACEDEALMLAMELMDLARDARAQAGLALQESAP
jgi:nitrogen fixation protein NifZ